MNPCQRIRRPNRLFRSLLLISALTFLCLRIEAAQAAPLGNPDEACWESVLVRIPGVASSHLVGVSASAPDDVWAVGGLFFKHNSIEQYPLIQHWDGHRWSHFLPPVRGNLQGIVAMSPADVWAVGRKGTRGSAEEKALILHWDGNHWSEVSTPEIAEGHNLFRLEAVSPNDIWATGLRTSGQPLILHWDGTAWSVVNAPPLVEGEHLVWGGSAVAADDVWLIGHSQLGGPAPFFHTLALHWDGASWTVIPSPNPSSGLNFLYDVVATSAGDALAVGTYFDDAAHELRALALHWDGQTWTVSLPNKKYKSLHSVAAVASGKLWGTAYDSETNEGKAHILKWDGERWRNAHLGGVPSNSPLVGLTALSNMNVWAVGKFQNENGKQKGQIVQRIPCE